MRWFRLNKKKAIFIVGSPRKDGNTALLTNKIIDSLNNDFETDKIFLSDLNINPCKECYHCMDKDEC